MNLHYRQEAPALPSGIDLCLIPAGRHPDGRPPNFVDPLSLQLAIGVTVAVMVALTFPVLVGRPFINNKTLKLADWTMVVGFVFDLGIMGTQVALSPQTRNIWDTPVCDVLDTYMKLALVIEIMTGPASFFPKAAIFLIYIQIFSSSKIIKKGSIIGIVMASIAYVPASMALIYYKAPHVGETWLDIATNGRSHKGIPGGITIGVASVIVDIYIFVLPLRTLAGPNMPLGKRIQIISLFATAFLGIVASVVCMVYRIKLLHLTDGTWQAGVVGIPIIIENDVAIIVGSLPAFAAFLRKYVGESSLYKLLRFKVFQSSHGSGEERGQNGSLETFGGSSKQRKRPPYFELSDGATLKSQIEVPGVTGSTRESVYQDGILRTVDFTQEESKTVSSERLV